jgi:predicted RNA binding protein YcfA (HicA-like mRNA interferase family)
MPKLPAVKPRHVIRLLEENGFTLDHTSGSHFVFYHPLSGRRAVVPQHNRDIPKGTLMFFVARGRIYTRGVDRFSCREVNETRSGLTLPVSGIQTVERETNEARFRRGYVKLKCHPGLLDGIFFAAEGCGASRPGTDECIRPYVSDFYSELIRMP